MKAWGFCGFHPFHLNVIINILMGECSSSTGCVNWCASNFMNKMNE